jgi:hypothetical protein
MFISAAQVVAHNQQFVRHKGRLRIFAASTATIVVRAGAEAYQVSQVGFGGDGSIMVQWPYLAVQQGIVAAIDLPDSGGSFTFKLHDTGRFTSQLVKFSHHASGAAHFSKTKYTNSEVRRQSFPLNGPIGRIFEQTVLFPEKFKPLTRLKPGRIYLEYNFGTSVPAALQVRGEWRRKKSITEFVDNKRATVGPITTWMHRITRVEEAVAFLSPPLTCPIKDYALCISCGMVRLPTGAASPGVVMLGAFDAHEVPDGTVPERSLLRGALVAMYPSKSDEELVARIGTIDIGSE